jgi:RNA polymerase sigma-70 factor, ECF subfamily
MERETLPRRFDDLWHDHRAHLLALASRMLGDPAAAEDVVQEAYGRLARLAPADRDAIDDPGGWLAVTVRRRCLDRIRSAAFRREVVAGPGSRAEPPDPADPADRVTLDDQVQAALAVVLDRLTPAERTAFVLHDVFGFPFAAVGEIVGRTPAACRQLASRARRAVRSGDRHGDPGATAAAGAEAGRRREVAQRFVAACDGGDLAALMAVLDPAVDGEAILLGHGPLLASAGRAEVAERLLALFGPGSHRRLMALPLGDAGGAIAYDVTRGRVVAVVRLDLAAGRVRHIHTYVRLGT